MVVRRKTSTMSWSAKYITIMQIDSPSTSVQIALHAKYQQTLLFYQAKYLQHFFFLSYLQVGVVDPTMALGIYQSSSSCCFHAYETFTLLRSSVGGGCPSNHSWIGLTIFPFSNSLSKFQVPKVFCSIESEPAKWCTWRLASELPTWHKSLKSWRSHRNWNIFAVISNQV